ncbi:hypothetical protein AB1286_10915 [Trinickia sp. NRRL B-1857]|jgi:hypothetical protein|uniref:hypothetical protein n=1 Tax=Trinickia sp. NRRL B-1857 TaxID=3162879 RepID=UPI003D2D65A1
MKSLTALGEFVVEVAYGEAKELSMTPAVAQQVRHELSDRMAGKIEEIRSEQRKAFENSKSVMVF